MGYYAVTRSGQDDELQHFKYIHKEKVNGKWRYYYKGDFDKHDNTKEVYEKTKGKPGTKYGLYEHGKGSDKRVVSVYKTNDFLSTSRKADYGSNGQYKYRGVGKIEQGYDSAKKKIKKFGKKSIKSLNKQIDRGQKWLNGLFD